jgi:hypothetical protein
VRRHVVRSKQPSVGGWLSEGGLEALFPGLEVLLGQWDALTASIRELDREIERLGRERYPETQRLRQVAGVGPITSLAPSCSRSRTRTAS